MASSEIGRFYNRFFDQGVQKQGVLQSEAKYDSTISNFSYGAGEGISGGLPNLFNDNSEESKLLGFQLQTLNNHSITLFN